MELLHTPINDWQARFLAFFMKFLAEIARREVVAAARSYLIGLLSGLANKNCWTIAEETGADDPQAHQRLLRQASWDEAQLSKARRDCIVDEFGQPDGLFILDETGFLKCGDSSVGVQRQYSGTAGKVENCQVAVFAAYASTEGRTLYDTRLYLPEKWTDDHKRREKAGVPDEVEFATKLELAAEMVDQAIDDGLPIGWVTADTVYGQSFDLRQQLIDHKLRFIMAVPKKQKVYLERPIMYAPAPAGGNGRKRRRKRIKGESKRVDEIVAEFVPGDFERIEVGQGSKGPRVFDWAARRVAAYQRGKGSQDLWLVVRRSVSRPSEVAYYLAWAPAQTTLEELARVAAGRWQIEECFAEGKGEVGLADYQVRKWRAWHRHMQLAMLAHLFLAQLRRDHGIDDVLGPLSAPEARRLLDIVLPRPPRSVGHKLRWSIWRREHNQKARSSHYRRRSGPRFKPK